MKRTVLLALATGGSVGAVFAGLMIARAIVPGNASTKTQEKRMIETAEASRQNTAESGFHAGKEPSAVTLIPAQASCPVDTSTVETRITGPIFQPPPGWSAIFSQITLVSEATAVGHDRHAYSLFFGYLNSDPSQPVIVRWRGAMDPCNEGRTDYDPEMHLLPVKAKGVTLTTIDGSRLSFTTSDGRSGAFDYTAGTFSPISP